MWDIKVEHSTEKDEQIKLGKVYVSMFKDDTAILWCETNTWLDTRKSVSSTCTPNTEFDGNGWINPKSFIS